MFAGGETLDWAKKEYCANGRFGLTAALCMVLACGVVAAPTCLATGGEAVIAPGQEQLLAEMVGRGAELPHDCVLKGGQIEGSSVRGTYQCPDGEVVLQLQHPDATSAAPVRTVQFAISVLSGSAPPELLAAVESRVRAREGAFRWSWLTPAVPPTALQPAPPRTSPPSPSGDHLEDSTSVTVAMLIVALFALAAACWSTIRSSRK